MADAAVQRMHVPTRRRTSSTPRNHRPKSPFDASTSRSPSPSTSQGMATYTAAPSRSALWKAAVCRSSGICARAACSPSWARSLES